MIYITGDTHGNIDMFPKLNTENFPQQKEMTKDDILIVAGDFGVPWGDEKLDKHLIQEYNNRNFTTCFVDGNHDNFDILNSLPTERWHGGNIHRVSDSIVHMMRGEIYDIEGYSFWTFGGARSHDIQGGILELTDPMFREKKKHLDHMWNMTRSMRYTYRINHKEWWKEEMPTSKEMEYGWENLKNHNFKVDFIITHCPPTSIIAQMGMHGSDELSDYLQKVKQMTDFKQWYFGHMHVDRPFYWERTIGIYNNITRLV